MANDNRSFLGPLYSLEKRMFASAEALVNIVIRTLGCLHSHLGHGRWVISLSLAMLIPTVELSNSVTGEQLKGVGGPTYFELSPCLG